MSNNKLENVIRYMLKARKLILNSSEKNDSMVLAQMNGIEQRSQKYSSICNLCDKEISVGILMQKRTFKKYIGINDFPYGKRKIRSLLHSMHKYVIT